MRQLCRLLCRALCLTGLCVSGAWADAPVKAESVLLEPLLQDPQWARGVHLAPFRPLASGAMRFATRQSFRNACLPLPDCRNAPAWSLQQWATARDITEAKPQRLPDGAQAWILTDNAQREQKRLQFGTTKNPGVQLGVNGLSEFAARNPDGVPQYLPDLRSPWPHLLLSQDAQGDRLSAYARLQLSVRYRMVRDEPQVMEGFQSGLHTARLVMALTVRNRLSGNYFWITLPLHDSRGLDSGYGCQKCTHDRRHCYTPHALDQPGVWQCPEDRVGENWWKNEKPGTGRMIFRVASTDFVRAESDGGYEASGDLLPAIRAGIEAVRQRHNGHKFPADLFFYEVGRLSVGWEITGFNHAEVLFHHVQLEAERK
jgi:hypothetical protein